MRGGSTMKHHMIHALSVLTLIALLASPVHATPPGVPSAIDQFVAKIFPKASHYFWVVNDTQMETKQEMIVDINTFVANKGSDQTPIENRFLLLVLNGEVISAHRISLGAKVDCSKDTKI